MTKAAIFVFLAGALIAAPMDFGQGAAEVRFAVTFKAQALAGIVVVEQSGPGVKGVLVEDCTPDWKAVLSSTTTDEKGHFSFSAGSESGLHYLRLSAPGFDQTLVKVAIRKGAHARELSLRIVIAT